MNEFVGYWTIRFFFCSPMDDLIRLGSLVSDSTLEEAKRSVSMNEPCLYGLSSVSKINMISCSDLCLLS